MDAFDQKDFFGSAVGGTVPRGWIDASTLREVPDHQEIFLSPTTLSNMIIELNEQVTSEDALSALGSTSTLDVPATDTRSGTPATTETIDKAAALYHLRDLCDDGDAMQIINAPHPVTLGRFSSHGSSAVPAYAGVVSYTTPRRQSGAGRIPVHGEGAAAGSSAMGPLTSKFTCHFLLARLKEKGTDLLVFVNVPHEEFDKTGDPRGLSREEDLASGLVDKMIETLEIKDWGLFGSE
ncbi:Ran-interacting protein Mog1, putative [Paecilomyces variotii No. 5]|uniref:Ran-interacting protein Mog1, putative n=1 Tax=Byssochlamys spectabilis (strain No. 5 / NBRC 109023) TaxID=1356009 RepID=V5FRZ9_BYSSN|nr:Ran-interacting protein Mog1, putative [Paecilomyces variotii No. 5]